MSCAATKVTTREEHSNSPARAGKETAGVELLSWAEHKEPAESRTRDPQNARDLYRIYTQTHKYREMLFLSEQAAA